MDVGITLDNKGASKLEEANKAIIVNTLYRHFKGNYYLVEKLARNESDGEASVVYTSVVTGQTFIRPYDEFFTDVSDREDNVTHQVYRFEPASEIRSLLKLTPTNELVEELETRADSPYESCKKIEDDENVWEVRYLLGRVVETFDRTTESPVEEFKPLTMATFDTIESAKKYKEQCYPNRPAVLARRVIRKIIEL